ncbi:hypothetical protein AEAC466_07890 [Asticcacaulis sp. AC466]|uniref:class I SAM-dependent methyltransferase n=1 Tax=Asticcacaulis sp. AC466 TaxID=1282362 RepID=UPI0003C3C732|nr:SAM-dependent methyltransferase [Asticcacaulis sp. AC466]ESQ84272.1 hypothetical protein AEAC466_07890 [Asticcacaulis sp. AC466]
MSDSIEHVSDTAFWVAYYRWLETQRPDALFHDPLAGKLVGDRGKALAGVMGIERAMAWSMSLRTYIIDNYILDAVAKGVVRIVNLGAGLDTRPYRLDLRPDIDWVEVDFAHMIDYKNDALSADTPRCKLERIACDLSQGDARRQLLDALDQRGGQTLVLTEGVIPYLTNADVADLANDLCQRDSIVYWITDYFSPFFHTMSARGSVKRQLAKNSPFRFNVGDQPNDWVRFFADTGWEVADMRYIGEEGLKLGRDLPANWIMRQFMRFAPEARLRPYRRMNGYALMQKGRKRINLED